MRQCWAGRRVVGNGRFLWAVIPRISANQVVNKIARAKGLGSEDTSSVARVFEELNGIKAKR